MGSESSVIVTVSGPAIAAVAFTRLPPSTTSKPKLPGSVTLVTSKASGGTGHVELHGDDLPARAICFGLTGSQRWPENTTRE